MSNMNKNECEAQMIDLNVMISRNSLNSQHGGGGSDSHPANVDCSYYWCTIKD